MKKELLNQLDLCELSTLELEETDGGLFYRFAQAAVGLGILAAAGAAIVGSFRSGVNQACG